MNLSKKIAIQGLLVALSLWIGTIEHYFSVAGIYLLVGLYLLPLFVINDWFGFKVGFWSCFAVCFIRMLFFSSAGILGFVLYLCPVIYMFFRAKECSLKKLIFFDIVGVLLTMLVKMPIFFFFLTSYLNMSFEKARSMILNYMIFTNIIGFSISIVLSRLIVFKKYLKSEDSN